MDAAAIAEAGVCVAAAGETISGCGGELKAGRRLAMTFSARVLLYVYVLLIACPIRYWPVELGVDPTWRFALNYAAANGLTTGVDTVFTTGPLAYLMFPQDIGHNLIQGLLFQAGVWLVLAAIFADVFFRSRFPVRNLAPFGTWRCFRSFSDSPRRFSGSTALAWRTWC
jgi:hypothetical protein